MFNDTVVQEQDQPEADRFATLAGETLGRVQTAFVDLVADVPGPTTRPSEIQKTLGLHKTLAWKLAKIVDTPNSISIFPRIPGQGALEKILNSAKQAGVAEERITSVRSAIAELDEFVVKHAGRRETLEIMLARLAPGAQKQTELGLRRDGFRSTSHIWGVQARTILRSVIAWPSDDNESLDAAVLFGAVDFLRLRSDRPWVINRWRPTDDDGKPIPTNPQAIDPQTNGFAPMLADFCSEPMPGVRRELREDLTIEDEVEAGLVGTPGAVTYFTGELIPKVMSKWKADRNEQYAQNLELRTPCQTVVFDHLVHRSLFGRVSPRLRVFGELAGRPLYATLRSDVDRLEVSEQVEYLGTGPAAVRTPDVPRYDRMVQHVCDRLGWSAAELDVYRVRMRFPYVPVTITYDYGLPERPA